MHPGNGWPSVWVGTYVPCDYVLKISCKVVKLEQNICGTTYGTYICTYILYIHTEKISIEHTSVGLVSARPNYESVHECDCKFCPGNNIIWLYLDVHSLFMHVYCSGIGSGAVMATHLFGRMKPHPLSYGMQ